MPIISTDLKYRLSGGAANADVNASLGGEKSSTEITSASLHNLFDQVSGSEAQAGDTEYRCFYIHNAHASLALQGAKVWIDTNTPSGDTSAEIALGISAVNGVEPTVANESTSPATRSAWQATFNYAVGDVVEPVTPNGFLYQATADAGNSGGAEPTWPTTLGQTVVDGGITWTCRRKPVFGVHANEGAALTIGDIPASQHQAVWVKRIVNTTAAAYNTDSVIIKVQGETAA
jgi:hypothetical protein